MPTPSIFHLRKSHAWTISCASVSSRCFRSLTSLAQILIPEYGLNPPPVLTTSPSVVSLAGHLRQKTFFSSSEPLRSEILSRMKRTMGEYANSQSRYSSQRVQSSFSFSRYRCSRKWNWPSFVMRDDM